MNNWDFSILLFYNLPDYILSLILIGIFYYLLLRKYILTLLDPIFFSFLGSAFAGSVVIFLFFKNQISDYYFSSYIFSQLLFICGFIVTQSNFNNNLPRKRHYILRDNDRIVKNLFIVSLSIFVITQILTYQKKGIPLFMDSRLEMFSDGGGDGVLARILYVTSNISSYLSIHYIYKSKKERKKIPKTVKLGLLFIFTTLLLSGSRSAFLSLIFIWFCYIIINTESRKETIVYLRKKQKQLIFPIIIIFITIFVFGTSGDLMSGLSNLGLRIVKNGDVFYYSYPNGIIEEMKWDNPFMAVFKDFLGLTRLYDWSELPQALGIELFAKHHKTDILMGPNSRLNFFGYVYFGYFGCLIFCFIIGVFIGFVRNRFFKSQNNIIINKIFWTLLYLVATSIETDLQLSGMYIDDIIFIYPMLVFLAYTPVILNRIKNPKLQFSKRTN